MVIWVAERPFQVVGDGSFLKKPEWASHVGDGDPCTTIAVWTADHYLDTKLELHSNMTKRTCAASVLNVCLCQLGEANQRKIVASLSCAGDWALPAWESF